MNIIIQHSHSCGRRGDMSCNFAVRIGFKLLFKIITISLCSNVIHMFPSVCLFISMHSFIFGRIGFGEGMKYGFTKAWELGGGSQPISF